MKSQQEIQKHLEEIGAKIDRIYREAKIVNAVDNDRDALIHILQVREDILEWVLEDDAELTAPAAGRKDEIMKINKGDLFRIKSTGEILEITGKWGDTEYRHSDYKADGRPDCGANGQHNIASNIEKWFADGGLEKIKPLPTKRALIRTYNYGNYYGKRFIVDNIEVDNAI